jgi:Ser/Thr protein kinase RdoA (MazF antagonist)
VFVHGDERVLRRYRRRTDAAHETAVMTYVAAHGFPVPAVFAVDGGDIVMERLDGPTMAQAMTAGSLAVEEGARMLAELHDRLHALPARSGRSADDRVLHLDLHPENVMVTPHPVVIDWANATDGPADLDLAMSALILAQVAIDPGDPRAALARVFLDRFSATVTGDPQRLLDQALTRRAADPNLTETEHSDLSAAAQLVRVTCHRHG